jgi:hypothetical protein
MTFYCRSPVRSIEASLVQRKYHLTVIVPTIPASLCPGKAQIIDRSLPV